MKISVIKSALVLVLIACCCQASFAGAGIGWNATIYNDTKEQVTIKLSEANGWDCGDFGAPGLIKPGEVRNFYSRVSQFGVSGKLGFNVFQGLNRYSDHYEFLDIELPCYYALLMPGNNILSVAFHFEYENYFTSVFIVGSSRDDGDEQHRLSIRKVSGEELGVICCVIHIAPYPNTRAGEK